MMSLQCVGLRSIVGFGEPVFRVARGAKVVEVMGENSVEERIHPPNKPVAATFRCAYPSESPLGEAC
jgi:hypothetical protein